MINNTAKSNQVNISGEIVSEFTFSHQAFGEKFYMVDVAVRRLSDQTDVIPLMVSERIFNVHKDYRGFTVEVVGQFRSYIRYDGTKNRLLLSVFVTEVHFAEQCENFNYIFLEGYIVKPPIYRETPMGREIADIMISVTRSYKKTDYIPCITWGRSARFISRFGAGTKVRFYGRIQSRKYKKKLDDLSVEIRTAYEVSIWRMEVLEDESQN